MLIQVVSDQQCDITETKKPGCCDEYSLLLRPRRQRGKSFYYLGRRNEVMFYLSLFVRLFVRYVAQKFR